MNNKSNRFSHRMCLVLCAALFAVATAGRAGVSPPIYVGNTVPVLDEYGRPMMGSNLSEDAANRPRIEIRTTTDGVLRPPLTNGAAHPYNPLLQPDSVGGMGMNSSRPDTGIFCMVLSNRPAAGTKVFARVFNAPTPAEASFYADSALVEAPAHGTSLALTFSAAQPLDAGDADGDGLNNSWEKALGIDDRLTPDYDGDGMLDLHEMLAGTAADDPGSMLAFRAVSPDEMPGGGGGGASPVRVRWQSVPGKSYQLQFVPTLLGPQNFIPVGDVVTAAEGEFEIDMLVEIPEGTAKGSFRIRLETE